MDMERHSSLLGKAEGGKMEVARETGVQAPGSHSQSCLGLRETLRATGLGCMCLCTCVCLCVIMPGTSQVENILSMRPWGVRKEKRNTITPTGEHMERKEKW